MRLFSKIAFIFNLAFLFAATMRLIERKAPQAPSPLSAWQPVENTLIVMGYVAILVNTLFLFSFMFSVVAKKLANVPRWLWIFNIVIFILQLLYFFVLP